jgi:hypothetical protein
MTSNLPVVEKKYAKTFGLKFYDASDIMPLRILREKNLTIDDVDLLAIINLEEKVKVKATLMKHFKFSYKQSVCTTDEENMFQLVMMAIVFTGLPQVMFKEKEVLRHKMGCYAWNNEYKTSLRIWTTKKVGKNIVFEITVSSYKDGVTEPLKE